MSGLAGLWNLDDRPVDRAIVTSMAAAIAHRGTDHTGIWSAGPVSLVCHLLRVAPESEAECQPVFDDFGNALVFDGRLDNRDELLETVTAMRVARESPDSELVLAAYREWGDRFLGRLHGDFALVLFDSHLQTLVLARDPVGCRPLYYATSGTSLVFASEIKAILSHPDVRVRPNEDLLADFFLLDQLPYEDDGETFFQDVRAVLPGCRVSVGRAGVASRRFWDFDPTARVRYRSYGDYAEHLRALLMQAVKRRMRSADRIAVSVSGGLDSSVVLCIADDLRRSGATDVRLLPVSYTPAHDSTTEENRFIRLLEVERRLSVSRLPIGRPGDVAQLAGAAWHSELPLFTRSWCTEDPLLAHAHEQGAKILLTGLWSDQFFFVMGYLVDLFVRLQWRDIARHLEEYRNWFVDADAAYFRARLRQELLINLTPRALRNWLRPFRTALTAPRTHPLVSHELTVRLTRRRPRISHPRYATAHARNIYQNVRRKSHRLQFEADEKMASRYEIERLTPFLDRDVIAYLMSIPGEIQTRSGVPRALLRDAMRGVVPDAILSRRWREEGADAPALARAQRAAYLATGTHLHACKTMGFCRDGRPVDADSLEFIGLEFWSRAFFSDRLCSPKTVGQAAAI